MATSAGEALSAVPEVSTDATLNDCLSVKLEPDSHHGSMSSSSSISSSDTVIDLSLPNLARKSFISMSSASSTCSPSCVNCCHSALVSYDVHQGSKNKSNPNHQQRECPKTAHKPSRLQPTYETSTNSPSRLTPRRHTWSRLYLEGLKQSAANRLPSGAASAAATASMSKSLGDLTSDDISCNFDSKYRSISRSFIVRPTRDLIHKGNPEMSWPPNDLTEQLRKLTNVEPLTAKDFDHKSRPSEAQHDRMRPMRRTSSRSLSRVRSIANRAKKAQERQRLHDLIQGRSASFGLTSSADNAGCACSSEERGNPEGACYVAQSPCTPHKNPFPQRVHILPRT
ncbi:LOW QUALITY PROTEIN: 1-phosphatidylinositol 4,5-bisphosphate phosphodiesterase eta-2-like [Brachionichthys hirsutus]|uniref:LOW QUALITY PROTEIN: 1-phosphatidylinositol 4,5-bisphosphate phosphodiesterase eta-2-like n=1 Tax=Brachionichthys hirsutus TaxID=412623 RepID=UPI003604A24A